MTKDLRENCRQIPNKPGVYFFRDRSGRVLYVGKARNLHQRVRSYFLPSLLQGPRTQNLVNRVEKIDFQVAESEFDALLLEAMLIKKYQPKFNSKLKDDKSFLYIKVTSEEFPRVYPARKISDGYGPFPQARTVRQILKFLRQIFPYRSCRKLPKKTCLYFDLKLCPGPCEGKTGKNEYRKTIRALRGLLEGRSEKVRQDLALEMQQKAARHLFEEAARIRDQKQKIEWLGTFRQSIASYLENPNLIEDIRAQESEELLRIIKPHLLVRSALTRIEAYDVSNIKGKQATGSLVVFVQGEPEKASYRRFKIKFVKRPNDVAMIEEMLKRRFKHPEWETPDLILVDGGKGQVGAVREVLRQEKLKIPFIGLAKRWETLVIPQPEGFKQLRLPGNSPGLSLLKRIRDEAHRFALTYHRKLRAFDRVSKPLVR